MLTLPTDWWRFFILTTQTVKPDPNESTWAEEPEAYDYITPQGGSYRITKEARTKIPPIDKRNHGFKGGEALPSAWLNWLFRQAFRGVRSLLEQQASSDGQGLKLFPFPGLCMLLAIDRTTPSHFLLAVGWKADHSSAPHLNLVTATGLGLGTPTAAGDVPITGGQAADIQSFGLGYGLSSPTGS